MRREESKRGMLIRFGRPNGEKTLAKITGNTGPRAASVELLEQRGCGKGNAPGSKWRVEWSMVEPAEAGAKPKEFNGFPVNAPLLNPPPSELGVISRDEAFALAPDYVKYIETTGDYELIRKVLNAVCTLRQRQLAVTFFREQYYKVRVTVVDRHSFRAIDGPVVRVRTDTHSWRVDGNGTAWPLN